jgi:hypothetical protein
MGRRQALNAIVNTFGAGTDVFFSLYWCVRGGGTRKKYTDRRTILACTRSTAKAGVYVGLRTVRSQLPLITIINIRRQ